MPNPYEKYRVIWVDEWVHRRIKKAASDRGIDMIVFMRELAENIDEEGNTYWIYVSERDLKDLMDLARAWGCSVSEAFSNVMNAIRILAENDYIAEYLKNMLKKKERSEVYQP